MESPRVPSIDLNASLKVESEEVVDGNISQEEKKGKVLLILGTIAGFLILIGVAVLGFAFFSGSF